MRVAYLRHADRTISHPEILDGRTVSAGSCNWIDEPARLARCRYRSWERGDRGSSATSFAVVRQENHGWEIVRLEAE
jgi:hypothetical protein